MIIRNQLKHTTFVKVPGVYSDWTIAPVVQLDDNTVAVNFEVPESTGTRCECLYNGNFLTLPISALDKFRQDPDDESLPYIGLYGMPVWTTGTPYVILNSDNVPSDYPFYNPSFDYTELFKHRATELAIALAISQEAPETMSQVDYILADLTLGMQKPTLLREKTEYTGAIFTVKNQKLAYANGQKFERQVVLKKNSVVALLVHNNQVFIQNEYRSGVGSIEVGFPAGTLEPNEDPQDAIIREVKEETGIIVTPDEIRNLGTFTLSEGFTNEKTTVFAITVNGERPHQEAKSLDNDEFIGDSDWVSFDDAKKLVSAMSCQYALAAY